MRSDLRTKPANQEAWNLPIPVINEKRILASIKEEYSEEYLANLGQNEWDKLGERRQMLYKRKKKKGFMRIKFKNSTDENKAKAPIMDDQIVLSEISDDWRIAKFAINKKGQPKQNLLSKIRTKR